MNLHGASVHDQDRLVLLAVLGADDELEQALVEADGCVHIYAPFLQVKLDSGHFQFAQGLFQGSGALDLFFLCEGPETAKGKYE
jgi:hypothetical protein